MVDIPRHMIPKPPLPPPPRDVTGKVKSTNKDLHVVGAKDDAEKPQLRLVIDSFAHALWQVGRVGTFGAHKYTEDGWVHVENGIQRYTNAMYRHLLLEAMGEEDDKESELMHSAHTAWNALARLELQLRQRMQNQK